MEKKYNLEEELLYEWVLISAIVNNKRIMNNFSYNETVVLFLLSLNDGYASYNDLLNKTKILKSQFNRTITSLEEKGFVKRVVNVKDKRKMDVYMTESGKDIQEKVHERSIVFSSKIIDIIGKEDSVKLIEIFKKIVGEQEKVL